MAVAAAALRGNASGGVAANATCRPAIRSDSGGQPPGLVDVGHLQHDGPEHVDDDQVGGTRSVRRVESGAATVPAAARSARVRADRPWPADHQTDGAGVRREVCPQIQGKCLAPFSPRAGSRR